MGRPFKDKDEEEHSGLQTRSTSRAGILDEKSALDTAPLDPQLEVPVGVVEQRVSNLVQGALCLVLLTGPFLHVLNLIPRGMHQILSVPLVRVPKQSVYRCFGWAIVSENCVLYGHVLSLVFYFTAGSWVQMHYKATESR